MSRVWYRTIIAIAALVAVAATAAPALAGSKAWTPAGHGGKFQQHSFTNHGLNCRYVYKSTRHGYRIERKCTRPKAGARSFRPGPPPWAGPNRHGHYRQYHRQYRPPRHPGFKRPRHYYRGSSYGCGQGEMLGQLVAALVAGAVGGGKGGFDPACLGGTLDHAPAGQPIGWENPDTGAQYRIVPAGGYESTGGRYCREFTSTADVGGRPQQVYGTACRQPDGSWEIMS